MICETCKLYVCSLYRLDGKSIVWDLCLKFGITEGTVQLFTFRITLTLKSLKSHVIIWPHDDYYQEVRREFEEKCKFPNVIGVLDGSHINLFETSSKPNKNVYFTRKYRYTIHLQTVVDYKGLFIFYDIVYSASAHDAKVF
ncbi:putative nuclease HARBI1 [Rhizophagus irregularis DAOM 181602=DAOM 197198]|nr:putative nuclease HARBI1 [Rhizophagus irregularis DAOM 181602=DAOM 197198]